MIELQNLEMVYPGGITGLHNTSLRFRRGDFTVLLGPSGAGKSTLLRCLNFLNRPTCGRILFEGLGPITPDRKSLAALRKRTAMIFQQHQLIPTQTAIKNVSAAFLGRCSTWRSLFPPSPADLSFGLECLDRVGLLDKALCRVDSLSGGQQQRVGIARALAQRPKVILADEPVASLDPETSKKVLSLFYTIAKKDGISAIVSLHQVELAVQYADRVIAVAGGRVVFDNIPDQLTSEALDRIYQKDDLPSPAAAPLMASEEEIPSSLSA